MAKLPKYRDFESELQAGRSIQAEAAREYLNLKFPDREYDLLDTRGDGDDYAFYDFFVVDRDGFPIEALEVKSRRCSKDQYPTAMFPLSKHTKAVKLLATHHVCTYGISRYTDGLGYVDLTEAPQEEKWYKRPGHTNSPTKHGLWPEKEVWECNT